MTLKINNEVKNKITFIRNIVTCNVFVVVNDCRNARVVGGIVTTLVDDALFVTLWFLKHCVVWLAGF